MLWVAAENRSNTERTKCKIVNKLKKYMIHFRRFQIRDVVTKKLFKIKVDAHVSGKILPVGSVTQICYLISFNGKTSTVQAREGILVRISNSGVFPEETMDRLCSLSSTA